MYELNFRQKPTASIFSALRMFHIQQDHKLKSALLFYSLQLHCENKKAIVSFVNICTKRLNYSELPISGPKTDTIFPALQ